VPKAYLVKISDFSQSLADSGIDMRVVVEISDKVIPGGDADPHERAKQVAKDAVNERWQKVSRGSNPAAMLYFAVEEFSGDLETLTPGYKPYRSIYGDRGWILHGPQALNMSPDDWRS
jgi:hypothetical protein